MRIVLRLERRGNVVVLERSSILNRDEVKAWFRLEPHEEVIRLPDHMHDGGEIAAAHLLQGNRVVDEHRLDLDPKPLEDDLSGQVSSAPGGVERHLSTGEVLERLELLPRIDVNLGQEQRRDVLDPVLDIRNLHLAPEVVQDVGLRDRDIDPAQVEQVGDVADGAVGDHGDDPKVVPIIEGLGQIGRIADEGALKQPPPATPTVQAFTSPLRELDEEASLS